MICLVTQQNNLNGLILPLTMSPEIPEVDKICHYQGVEFSFCILMITVLAYF